MQVFDCRCWTNQDAGLRRLSHPVNDSNRSSSSIDAKTIFSSSDNSNGTEDRGSTVEGAISEEKISVFGLVPDVVVPFATSIEIGLLTSVESYKYQMMKQVRGVYFR